VVFVGLLVRRPLWSGAGLAAIALAGSTLFAGTLKPELAGARSIKTFAWEIHRRIGDAPLYIPWGHDYELSFYYGRGIPGLDEAGSSAFAGGGPVYVVARPRELSRIPPATLNRMKPMMLSGLIGGGGSPVLYELPPPASNSTAPATK
jgi:hypothetical protein